MQDKKCQECGDKRRSRKPGLTIKPRGIKSETKFGLERGVK